MSGSGISWTICKSAHRSWQITTPTPHHPVFYRSDALPAAQPTASKHWRQKKLKSKKTDMLRSIGKQSGESVESVRNGLSCFGVGASAGINCAIRKFGYLQNKGNSLWNFPNSGLWIFRHGNSMVWSTNVNSSTVELVDYTYDGRARRGSWLGEQSWLHFSRP